MLLLGRPGYGLPREDEGKRGVTERGKLEAGQHEPKSIGTKRPAAVYAPPGYSKDKGYKGDRRGVGAFGWGGAYGTESWADPELGVAAVMFIQMQPAPANVKSDFQKALRNAIVA